MSTEVLEGERLSFTRVLKTAIGAVRARWLALAILAALAVAITWLMDLSYGPLELPKWQTEQFLPRDLTVRIQFLLTVTGAVRMTLEAALAAIVFAVLTPLKDRRVDLGIILSLAVAAFPTVVIVRWIMGAPSTLGAWINFWAMSSPSSTAEVFFAALTATTLMTFVANLVLAAHLCAAGPASAADRLGVRAAIARSLALTCKRHWLLMGVWLLMLVVFSLDRSFQFLAGIFAADEQLAARTLIGRSLPIILGPVMAWALYSELRRLESGRDEGSSCGKAVSSQ